MVHFHSVSGNPELCVSGNSCQTTTDGKKNKLPVVLGSSIPSFVVFCSIVGAAAAWHHRQKTAAVALVSAGQAGGANKPNGTPPGGKTATQMVGEVAEAVIKDDIEEQITSEINNQIDEIAQNTAQQQDGNNA